MLMRTSLIVSSLILALYGATVSFAAPAPGFTLPTANGTVTLDSLRGRAVYLDFWASWCDPCRKSFPWMDALQRKFADKGLAVIAVNLDARRESADKFLAAHPAGFTIAFDPQATLPPLYNIKAMPTSFLIDKDGNIVSSHTGFQEKDTATLEKQVMEILSQ